MKVQVGLVGCTSCFTQQHEKDGESMQVVRDITATFVSTLLRQLLPVASVFCYGVPCDSASNTLLEVALK